MSPALGPVLREGDDEPDSESRVLACGRGTRVPSQLSFRLTVPYSLSDPVLFNPHKHSVLPAE